MLKIQHVSYSLLFIILFAPLDLSNNFICMFSCILCMVMIRCGFFYLLVARCQSDSEDVVEAAEESSDIGIVGDDVQDFGDGTFPSAPGIETISVFPKNSARCKNGSV